MKEKLETRLNELKAEYESGQRMLANLEIRQQNLREAMLRISGAIQVIEEVLEKNGGTNGTESETDTVDTFEKINAK